MLKAMVVRVRLEGAIALRNLRRITVRPLPVWVGGQVLSS